MLDAWMYFPVAVFIGIIAMMLGVGGGALFTPFLLLVAGLPPSIAAATALFIEVFGFGSGLQGFVRAKLISYSTGLRVLVYSIPAALVGVFLQKIVPDSVVVIALTLLLIVLAMLMSAPEHLALVKHHGHHAKSTPEAEYTHNHPIAVRVWSCTGGVLAGLVSAGMGEINDYLFLKKYKMKGSVAAGTSVFVVAVTVLVGSLVQLFAFKIDPTYSFQVFEIVLFSAPGVIIGAQVGVQLAKRMDDEIRKRALTTLFAILAVVTASGLF